MNIELWTASTTQNVLANVALLFQSFEGLIVFAVGIGLALLLINFVLDRFF
ncbi:MAG: hypothetical protein QXR88_02320 [Candidatus Pacearchaeota archaeon]